MNKYIKYCLIIAVVALLAYKSVHFEKLSAMKNAVTEKFDATAFSQKLWKEKMPVKLDSAISLQQLKAAVEAKGSSAIDQLGNSLSIGNYRYCLVKVTGTVAQVNEDDIQLKVNYGADQPGDTSGTATLATEYIYGNAIRDASGLVQVKDYPNTSDLNNISESLNKIVRTELLPSFRSTVKKGDQLNIVAAVELNKNIFTGRDWNYYPYESACNHDTGSPAYL
ncbi:DUF2291 domain-containing protein [Ferruginibacter sp.]